MLDFLIEKYVSDYHSLSTLNEDSEVRAYKKLLKKIIKDLKKVNNSFKTNQINFAMPSTYYYGNTSMSNSSATSSADVIPTYDGGGEMQTMGESQDLMIQQIQNSVFRALNENSYTPQMQTQQVQQQQFVPQMQTQQVQQQQFVPQMQTQQVKPKNVKLPSDEELMKMNSIYTNVALSLNPTTSLKTENENPFKSDPMIQKIKNIKYSESDINEMNNLFKNTTQMNVVLPSKPDLSQLKSVSN